jgi:hypothetical protein
MYGTARPQAKMTKYILIDEKYKIPYINNTDRECKSRMYLMDVKIKLNKL